RVVVEVNGQPLAPLQMPDDETLPVSIPLDLKPGASKLLIRVSGGAIAARAGGVTHVPWNSAAVKTEGAASALTADVSYDVQSVKLNSSVLGTMTLRADRAAEVPMVEWGLPAGFVPIDEDLASLKAKGTITRSEKSGRKLRLYLPDLKAGTTTTLSVRFQAGARGRFSSPAGRAYEYYRAAAADVIAKSTFQVE
ncbi:MAG TPA: hypothetical protein VEJ63_15290, partial [Planctomycetota bacterium]|nr:hypothetical protein [Planctomycetota bacterium]